MFDDADVIVEASKISPSNKKVLRTSSDVFNVGHERFIKDIFDDEVHGVLSIETDADRIILLAGSTRLRLNKKTGIIHWEALRSLVEIGSVDWVRRAPDHGLKFWISNARCRDMIWNAWARRLRSYFAADCDEALFPDLTGYKREEASRSVFYQALIRRVGAPAKQMVTVKYFVGRLWKFLVDQETLKLCLSYFGRAATIYDYNFTVRRIRDLERFSTETRSLTPLIGEYLKYHQVFKYGRHKIPLDIVARAKQEFFKQELTPAAWRYFAKSNAGRVSFLMRLCFSLRSEPWPLLCRVLNLLCKIEIENLPQTFVGWLVLEIDKYYVWITHNSVEESFFIRFARLAAQASILHRRQGTIRSFVRGDLNLAWDWFCSPNNIEGVWEYDEHGGIIQEFRAIQKNETWNSIMRHQREWHQLIEIRLRARREADARRYAEYIEQTDAIVWNSSIDSEVIDGVNITALTSGLALRKEHELMQHCVDGYIDVCLKGVSRIFHFECGLDMATLELQRIGTAWKIRQLYSQENTVSPDYMLNVARKFARLFNAANKAEKRSKLP